MEKLQQIIQQLTNQELGNHSNIDNTLADDLAKETGSSLIDGLKSAISGGNISDLTAMLGNSDQTSLASQPIIKDIISSLTSKLGGSKGLDSNIAGGFASAIIPKIISMVSSKIQSGELNIADIVASFSGTAGAGLDQNGDGKIGIDDAISAVTNGKLGDVLGGLFKK